MTLKDALAIVDLEDRVPEKALRKFTFRGMILFPGLTVDIEDAWLAAWYQGRMQGVKEGHRFALIDVAKALRDSGRSQTETAALLGVSQSTAHRILKESTASEVLKERRQGYE